MNGAQIQHVIAPSCHHEILPAVIYTNLYYYHGTENSEFWADTNRLELPGAYHDRTHRDFSYHEALLLEIPYRLVNITIYSSFIHCPVHQQQAIGQQFRKSAVLSIFLNVSEMHETSCCVDRIVTYL